MIENVVQVQTDYVQSELEAGRPVDLVEHFARVVPIVVSCRLLGIDANDAVQLSRWLSATQLGAAGLRPSDEDLEELAGIGEAITLYLDEQFTKPIGAGFETTSNLIASAAHLVMNAGEEALLHSSEVSAIDWVDAVVEETLRLESPVQTTVRNSASVAALDIGGQAVPSGASVLVMIGAAHRDPKMFPQPQKFLPARCLKSVGTPSPPTLAFGSRIHHCLGIHLARLQARIALRELLPLLEGAGQIQKAPQWRPLVNIRGLERRDVVARLPEASVVSRTKGVDKLRKARARKVRNV